MKSLANSLENFLVGQQRGIPQASEAFLRSERNPNIRNFRPGNQPGPELLDPFNGSGSAIANSGFGQGVGGLVEMARHFLPSHGFGRQTPSTNKELGNRNVIDAVMDLRTMANAAK